METTLIVSVILLWVLSLALFVGLVALSRQVGILHQRIAPAGALALSGGVTPGDIVPDLQLETITQKQFKLLDQSRKKRSTLITFVSPECSVCEHLMPSLKAIRRQEEAWLTVMLASDGDAPQHQDYIIEKGLSDWPYTLSRELGMTFEVGKLPYSVLIDEDGKLVAKGLTNTREHVESLFEAKNTGVESIQKYLKLRNAEEDKPEQKFPQETV